MTMKRPSTTGLRHIALFVENLEACVAFYTQQIGMVVEWQPDPDNVYLTTTHDNLALHRVTDGVQFDKAQRLDHIGFILNAESDVDAWYEYLQQYDVPMKTAPRTHRDGARSFYCTDPDGNSVQMIYHPPLVR